MDSDTQLSTHTQDTGMTLIPKSYQDAMQFSEMMAKADLLPQHLRGKPADCFRIVAQAARWGMDPFAVADKTSVISGKIMYEGQLTAAVINSRGNLKGRLRYDFEGSAEKPATLKLTVSGTIQSEDAPRTISLSYSQAKAINRNGQMDKNPEQQMCYIGARIWARRHMPELILGVYGPDEDMQEDTESDQKKPEMKNVSEPEAEKPKPKDRPSAPPKRATAPEKATKPKDPEPEPETESDTEPADSEFELTDDEPNTEAEPAKIDSIDAGQEHHGVKIGITEVKKIKIGGKPGMRLQVTGAYTGEVLSFEGDKFDECELAMSEGQSISATLKGVKSSKDPSKVFIFAEDIK